ncbi:MAG: TetR/AcrR family transcriptional regulator [Microbacteriaceae bacterium]|nr:TetR/AcrR family transcriptional regulator [Microbacteriaceae bacterium]
MAAESSGAPSRELLEYLDELERVVAGSGGRRGATRARLLDAAIESFRTSGFAATSVRALAEQVGITSAAVYAHFASKQELLGVAVATAQLRFLRAVVLPTDPDSPAEARIEGLVRRHMAYELTEYGRRSWFDLLLDNHDELGLLGDEHAARSMRMHGVHLAELERALAGIGAGGRLEAEIIMRICENSVSIARSVGGAADEVIDDCVGVLRRLARD